MKQLDRRRGITGLGVRPHDQQLPLLMQRSALGQDPGEVQCHRRLPQLQGGPGRALQCLLIQSGEQTAMTLRPFLILALHERVTRPQRQR